MDTIREAPFGQLARWITRNRVFLYPDERPGFILPPIHQISGASSPIQKSPSAPNLSEGDEEKQNDDLARRPDQTTDSSENGSVGPPQRKSKDEVLVDWYNSEDDANPQNWSPLKKALVTFQLW